MYPAQGRSIELHRASVDVCERFLGVQDTEILFPADRTQALAMAFAPGDLYFNPKTGDQQIDIRHRSLGNQVGGPLGIATMFKKRYRQLIPEQGLHDSELVTSAQEALPRLDAASREHATDIVAGELVQLFARNPLLRDAARVTPGAMRIDVASHARELVIPRSLHMPIPVGNPSRILEWGAGIRTGLQRIEEVRNRMWSEAVLLHSSPFASRVNAGVAANVGVANTYCIEDDNTAVLEQLAAVPQYQQGFEVAVVDNELPPLDDDVQRNAIEQIHELLIPKGLFVVRGLRTSSEGHMPAQSLIDKITDGFTLLGKYTLTITKMDGVPLAAHASVFAKA